MGYSTKDVQRYLAGAYPNIKPKQAAQNLIAKHGSKKAAAEAEKARAGTRFRSRKADFLSDPALAERVQADPIFADLARKTGMLASDANAAEFKRLSKLSNKSIVEEGQAGNKVALGMIEGYQRRERGAAEEGLGSIGKFAKRAMGEDLWKAAPSEIRDPVFNQLKYVDTLDIRNPILNPFGNALRLGKDLAFETPFIGSTLEGAVPGEISSNIEYAPLALAGLGIGGAFGGPVGAGLTPAGIGSGISGAYGAAGSALSAVPGWAWLVGGGLLASQLLGGGGEGGELPDLSGLGGGGLMIGGSAFGGSPFTYVDQSGRAPFLPQAVPGGTSTGRKTQTPLFDDLGAGWRSQGPGELGYGYQDVATPVFGNPNLIRRRFATGASQAQRGRTGSNMRLI